MGNCLLIKLNHKQMLLRDVLEKVGDRLSEETVAEKVSQFCKYGNIFLFFELMSLRREIDKIREQVQAQHTK